MKRFFKNKWLVMAGVTVVMLVAGGITFRNNSVVNRITNIVTVPFAPVQKFFSMTGGRIQDGIAFFRDVGAVRKENEELKIEIDRLEKENLELKEFRRENTELRQTLNIKDQFADYEPVGANIIAKDAGNWFNVFTIDRGAKDGMEKNFPVVTSKGLVGRIIQVDALSSKVEAIIDKNSVISAWISQKGGHTRVKGDLQLKDSELCIMDRIDNEVDVAVQDDIITSGIGGIYPRGIVIGKVKEVRKASDGLSKYAIIEPAVDFRRLDMVMVLKNKSESSGSGQ